MDYPTKIIIAAMLVMVAVAVLIRIMAGQAMEITLSLTADERIPMRRFTNDMGQAAPEPAMQLALREALQRNL